MPAEILSYFDQIAAQLEQARSTRSLGRLLKLSGKKPDRGGGPSAVRRASLHRKAESVRMELIIQLGRAVQQGPISRGTLKEVIAEVARQEKMSVSAVRTMVSRARFMDSAKSAVAALEEFKRRIGPAGDKRLKLRAAKEFARRIAALDLLQNVAGSPTN